MRSSFTASGPEAGTPIDGGIVHQINWQTTFGGGEVYTRFVCEALARLGRRTTLYVHRDAGFWSGLELHGAAVVRIANVAEIESALQPGSLVLTHSTVDAATAGRWSAMHRLGGMLHMPLYDRAPGGLAGYRRIFGVSEHVLASARARGLANLHPEPLLGVADLSVRGEPAAVIARPPYEPGSRKPRDRLVAATASLASRLKRPRFYAKPKDALVLGIVSRLTPIKQFPLLFSLLAPVIAPRPGVRLEIFGSGEYASVRDLKRALASVSSRVRFWGPQTDVAAVYAGLDYVLSGLPEKEALGLNLIEAQAAGTPVIAVDAPPFTETVVNGETGFLYRDPREDRGEDFRALLDRLLAGAPRPEPRRSGGHLSRFGLEAFATRLARALDSLGT